MVVTITRDVREHKLWNFGIFEGLYGGFWGIIAGPTGIRLSKLNNLSQTQCLWKAYITFIFLTLMGSIVGFSLNIIMIHDELIHDPYFCNSDSALDTRRLGRYIDSTFVGAPPPPLTHSAAH